MMAVLVVKTLASLSFLWWWQSDREGSDGKSIATVMLAMLTKTSLVDDSQRKGAEAPDDGRYCHDPELPRFGQPPDRLSFAVLDDFVFLCVCQPFFLLLCLASLVLQALGGVRDHSSDTRSC